MPWRNFLNGGRSMTDRRDFRHKTRQTMRVLAQASYRSGIVYKKATGGVSSFGIERSRLYFTLRLKAHPPALFDHRGPHT
jgi:hypothetical protein